MAVESQLRHKRAHPCPVCKGYDEAQRGKGKRCSGFTSADREWCRCSREEHAGILAPEDSGAGTVYVHKLHGPCKCGTEHAPAPYRPDEIEATYDYRDESGSLLYQVVRKVGKRFLQRKPDGAGGWVWKLGDTKRVLYRLPELIASTDQIVYVVEGEKDVETLRALGLTATCNAGGAGKWHTVSVIPLRDRHVILIADADEPGRRHARQVIVSLPGATAYECPSPHKDVSDLLAAGGSLDDLVPLATEPEPEPQAPPDMDPPEPEALSDEDLAAAAPRCTDAANAEAIKLRHGDGFRFVIEWDAWITYDGKRWSRQGAALSALRAALASAREDFALTKAQIAPLVEARRVAMLEDDTDKAKDIDARINILSHMLKHHEQSQNAARLKAAVDLLRMMLPVRMAELDESPWLLNVDNGTVDLRRAELLPHTREHMLTQLSPIEWDDAAVCPTWQRFLSTAMGADTTMAMYLQRLVGYALAGVIHEHVLLFFWGAGQNGKSTFLRTIQTLFGEYGCAAPRDLLFEPRGGAKPHPSELARLYGKRLAVCAEVGDGHRFDEAKIKDLTGGDTIACRRMNEDWWEYRPTHTLFLAGNTKPVIVGSDLGIWRRVRLIPWTVTVADADVDHDLPAKLARELPGILRWAVHGSLEWQRLGLVEPDRVRDATQSYRNESDVLGAFLDEQCVFEGSGRLATKVMRERYERWCKDGGFEPVGGRRLNERLRERGCEEANVRDGQRTLRGWAGVRLKSDLELMSTAEPATGEPLS